MKLKHKLLWMRHSHFSERLDFFRKAMRFISSNNIPGDYLEFGVYKARTFTAAYDFAKLLKIKDMRFFAFDSFQGFPELKNDPHWKTAGCYMDRSKWESVLESNGVELWDVEIVEGWYNDTLNDKTKRERILKKAAFIYVDCDIYKSTVPVLDFITNLVQDGTVIGFDDWNFYKGNSDYGQRRAFYEWQDRNPNIIAEPWICMDGMSQSFILHPSNKAGAKK